MCVGLSLDFLSCSIDLCLCFCARTSVLITVASYHSLMSGSLIPPAPFWRIALAIQGLLCFHINCKSFCFSSVKNAIGKLIGIALNL